MSKVALVTGGGSGIGRACAVALAKGGFHVVVTGRRQDALDQTVDLMGGGSAIAADITDPGAVDAMFARISADHGRLDLLFNNAGMMAKEDLLADPVDLSVTEATVTTNILGPIRLTAALLPHLRAQPVARVVNVTYVMVLSGLQACEPESMAYLYHLACDYRWYHPCCRLGWSHAAVYQV